jgi:hemin uptake protein HemP
MPETGDRSIRPSEASPPAPPKTINAESLFKEAREVLIDHAGVRYRLRITRRNKLILQK